MNHIAYRRRLLAVAVVLAIAGGPSGVAQAQDKAAPAKDAPATAQADKAATPKVAAEPTTDGQDAEQEKAAKAKERADKRKRKRAEAARRRTQAEEMLVRMQIEAQLNTVARWDAKAKRFVVKENGPGADLADGAPIEILCELFAEPAGNSGRITVRKDLRLQPFMMSIQKFMASGGIRDLQRAQEKPEDLQAIWADGIPPYMESFVSDLLAAMNAQDDIDLPESQRELESQRKTMFDKVALVLTDGFDFDPALVERRLRIVRELDRRLERELVGGRFQQRLAAIASSDRSQRIIERLQELAAKQAAKQAATPEPDIDDERAIAPPSVVKPQKRQRPTSEEF